MGKNNFKYKKNPSKYNWPTKISQMAFSMFYILVGTFSTLASLQSAHGTAQSVVSVTEGRHCGLMKNLSEKKTGQSDFINIADNNTEPNQRWTPLKRFLHDRSKIVYQQKPLLGSEFIGKRTSSNFLESFLSDRRKIIYQHKPRL